MNVVLLGSGIIPVPPSNNEMGGVEEYVYQLSHHLGQLGCQVYVIDIKGGRQQKEKRQKSAAKFYEVPSPPLLWKRTPPSFWPRSLNYLLNLLHLFLFALLSSLALLRLHRREKIEVINAYIGLPALTAMVVNKLLRKPVVTVFTSQCALLNTKPNRLSRIINFSEILPFKWADHIVTDTPTIKRVLVSDFGIDPAKITPMIEGIALPENEVEQFLASRKGPGHQSNTVLCVSSVNSTKNQLSAVKAVPQVIAVHPEVRFVFAGGIDANYFRSIQAFIDENNLADYVEFKGMVTREELYNLYNDAKLFVFPTTAESQGVVLVEAMTFGLPVVASSIEPIRDVVSLNEGSAILVDPYDVDGIARAVIRLLEDSSLRQSMSQKGQELARGLSSRRNAERLFALFNQLIEDKKKSVSGAGK